MAHPGGRPTDYCEKIVQEVCGAIASHAMGYRKISELYPHLPCIATIQNWIHKHPEFLAQYLQAKNTQAHILLDSTIDLANDNGDDTLIKINRHKLQIDTYKFNATRLNPKHYGERITKEVGPEGQTLLQGVIDKL